MLNELLKGRLGLGVFLFSEGDEIVAFVAGQAEEITAEAFKRYNAAREFIEELMAKYEKSTFAMSDGFLDDELRAAMDNEEFSKRVTYVDGRELMRLVISEPAALRAMLDSYGADFEQFQTVGIPDDFEIVGQVTLNQKAYHVPTGEDRARYDALTGAGEGEIFAVLDTGVAPNHPDLIGKVLDAFSEVPGEDYRDINGHGTHVFGTCCGHPDIALAHKAKGISIKVLGGREGSGLSSWIESGLRRARLWRGPKGERVTIINMSIGGGGFHAGTQREIELCEAAGIIVVAAAGNDGWRRGTDKVNWPARGEGCFATGAIDENENVASFTSGGPLVDGASAGVGVVSAAHTGGRVAFNGTSMASPNKSSEFGSTQSFLVRHGYARLDGTNEATEFHTKHARDIFDQGPDDATGEGVFDVYETLADETPDDVTMLASGLKSAIQIASLLFVFVALFASSAVAQLPPPIPPSDAPPTVQRVVTTIERTQEIFGVDASATILSDTEKQLSQTVETLPTKVVEIGSPVATVVDENLGVKNVNTEDGNLFLTEPGRYLVFHGETAGAKLVTVEVPKPEFDLSTIEPLTRQLADNLNDPATRGSLQGAYAGSAFAASAPDGSFEDAKRHTKEASLSVFRGRVGFSQSVDWLNGFQRPLQAELARLGVADRETYRLALLEVSRGLRVEPIPAINVIR